MTCSVSCLCRALLAWGQRKGKMTACKALDLRSAILADEFNRIMYSIFLPILLLIEWSWIEGITRLGFQRDYLHKWACMCNWNKQPSAGKAPETLNQIPERERNTEREGKILYSNTRYWDKYCTAESLWDVYGRIILFSSPTLIIAHKLWWNKFLTQLFFF